MRVECSKCGRFGRYPFQHLIEKRGRDVRIRELAEQVGERGADRAGHHPSCLSSVALTNATNTSRPSGVSLKRAPWSRSIKLLRSKCWGVEWGMPACSQGVPEATQNSMTRSGTLRSDAIFSGFIGRAGAVRASEAERVFDEMYRQSFCCSQVLSIPAGN